MTLPKKYIKIHVEWVDIVGYSPMIYEADIVEFLKPALIISEGWQYSKGDNLIMFASYHINNDKVEFGDCTCIPMGVIKKIVKL